MSTHRAAVDRLLRHLHLNREAPTLEYLHRIIREHQLLVPFETLTKLIDYEPGLRRGDFLPSMDEYVERIVTRGAGGLCWTLARGFQILLEDLEFDASLMYMAPGHCCVRVDLLAGPFYADVGYAAPLFQAYPLFESFRIETPREIFDYRVVGGIISVQRTPGPSKELDPGPRRIDDLRELIAAANDWSVPESFLHRLTYAGYAAGTYASVQGTTLTRHLPQGRERTELAAEDVPVVLAKMFNLDPALYRGAVEVQDRYKAR